MINRVQWGKSGGFLILVSIFVLQLFFAPIASAEPKRMQDGNIVVMNSVYSCYTNTILDYFLLPPHVNGYYSFNIPCGWTEEKDYQKMKRLPWNVPVDYSHYFLYYPRTNYVTPDLNMTGPNYFGIYEVTNGASFYVDRFDSNTSSFVGGFDINYDYLTNNMMLRPELVYSLFTGNVHGLFYYGEKIVNGHIVKYAEVRPYNLSKGRMIIAQYAGKKVYNMQLLFSDNINGLHIFEQILQTFQVNE